MGGWTKRAAVIVLALCGGAAPPPPPAGRGLDEPRGPALAVVIKAAIAERATAVETEIAARMMRRGDLAGDRRLRAELEIDLRIVLRAVLNVAADAKPETPEQALAWLRAGQIEAALRGLEDALGQEGAWTPGPSQKDAMAAITKLSYAVGGIKSAGKELDDFCRQLAIAVVNVVNATPVAERSLVHMRPPRVVEGAGPKDGPGTVAELTGQVQRLAAVSIPLRAQLLALAQAAAQEKEGGPLANLLAQSVSLAKGLQANTAVGVEARQQIEAQLAEGLVLYQDPRTRDAGKARVDALAQYRDVLGRIGRMPLSPQQMRQLAPALAWAQASGEPGMKLLSTIERYFEICARWDTTPRDAAAVMPTTKRAYDDLVGQFNTARAAFLVSAGKVGSGTSPADLDQQVTDLERLAKVSADVASAGPSMDVINAFKVRPAGAIERKIATSALASAQTIKSPTRNDADKYLSAVRELADYARKLTARNPADVPAGVLATWGGGKLDALDAKWKATVVDLAGTLIGGSIELDKARTAKLDTALALWAALRDAALLEGALTRVGALARWADWAIEPAVLSSLLTAYRDATAGAVAGYPTDNDDALARWERVRARYAPLAALIVRDVAAYSDACANLPIGFAGDVSRLATPMAGGAFAAEQFTSYAVAFWSRLERAADFDNADQLSTTLAKRLARELRMSVTFEERPVRGGRRRG
ncbi:MAG TPA: hypothetical protein VEA69_05650 [Tepidisphaeraceae bacterium]|nr:hypothetical protein [Tepidisphaeraceae bacterium]